MILRNDTANFKLLFQGDSLFSRDSLLNLSEEKMVHHGQLRPVFIKGKCLLQTQIEIEQTLG